MGFNQKTHKLQDIYRMHPHIRYKGGGLLYTGQICILHQKPSTSLEISQTSDTHVPSLTIE